LGTLILHLRSGMPAPGVKSDGWIHKRELALVTAPMAMTGTESDKDAGA
jgi:hypothetical protein